MPFTTKKVSLIFFVIVTLLLVGLVPLVFTGWVLSNKSDVSCARPRIDIKYN